MGAAVALLAIAVTAGACGAADARSSTINVTIDTFQFAPRRIHVHPGDTVVWTNHDDILHTVTSGTRTYDPGDSGRVVETRKDGMFDTPLDGRGATTRFTFKTAGTFHYFCDRHPGMEADVDVS